MIVTKIEQRDWDKKDGSPVVKVVDVTLDDGRTSPGYDLPSVPEVGKPLPDGWEFATGKSGKPYIKVPKQKKGGFGGATAFRNTKEGQAVEQERMDRRTALMQAVALIASGYPDREGDSYDACAERMYVWLRKTSGPSTAGERAPVSSPVPTQDVGGPTSEQGGERSDATIAQAQGPADAVAATPCSHTNTSPLLPSGRAINSKTKAWCLDCETLVSI